MGVITLQPSLKLDNWLLVLTGHERRRREIDELTVFPSLNLPGDLALLEATPLKGFIATSQKSLAPKKIHPLDLQSANVDLFRGDVEWKMYLRGEEKSVISPCISAST